jgi:hypothetical protein
MENLSEGSQFFSRDSDLERGGVPITGLRSSAKHWLSKGN